MLAPDGVCGSLRGRNIGRQLAEDFVMGWAKVMNLARFDIVGCRSKVLRLRPTDRGNLDRNAS
jgi:hypothetical protein